MFHWELNKEGISLSGILDKCSGVELWNNRHKFLKPASAIKKIELAGIKRTDSAGLATLIALCREAKQKNIAIKIHGASKQLLDIARLSGVDTILPFE